MSALASVRFPEAPASRAKASRPRQVQLDKVVVAKEAPPDTRTQVSRYHDLFMTLPYGHCLVCEPEDVVTLGRALRAWLKATRRSGRVQVLRRHPADARGRVWLLGEGS